jgi:steroid delta-isomerase-like uncharacterized protein
MSVEENKAIIRRWVDGLNRKDFTVVDELISEDYVYHVPDGPEIKGPQGLKQMFTGTVAAFPDSHYTIDDMVAEGNIVALRMTLKATNKGDYMGIPATGKNITLQLAFFYRLSGGKIVEALQFMDSLAMFQQLGVSPPGN